ncbi:MAG: hypothetical protein L0H53_02010 [Candidatus Nitrosocosmicus sp.]|nr:hypothetical protein [Candidatus Nitrosocosmicus sp.]MDN5866413.1 hypothetical protein [Candidatus Nitrosocosmicus sp.]
MSPDNNNKIQVRWIRLYKEAIVLQQDTRIKNVEKSCKMIKAFYPGNEIVANACNLVIDNQKQYRESVKKLAGYDDDKNENETQIN